MANRRALWVGLTLGAAAVAVSVGAGAYAFGPARAAASQQGRLAAAGKTGASASPSSGPTVGPPTPTESAPGKAPTSAPPPPRSATSAPPAPPPAQPAGCPQGDRQRDVEAALAQLGGYGSVTVDGVQSAGDCAAIRKFQSRYGISPAQGRAGPTTADVARRIATSQTATERAKCPAGSGLTVCVDLTQQTVWAVRGGSVVWGPTVIRTGMGGGYQTPAGTYQIFSRATREWSVPYKVWLPYWQAFNGGIGFHETTTYIHDGAIGSHGCVNLLHADAVSLWSLASVGTPVKVFGRRPGT
jgi:peptidoglycan hydrolase-like protein with peptidoglycan-binding domain